MRTVVIGSGNVADVMAGAIAAGPVDLVQIYARNQTEGRKLANRCECSFAHRPEDLANADLYLIAVSDKAIPDISKKLNFGDAVVAHTAGSVDVEALNDQIKHKAVLYPVQTFTKGRNIDIEGIPFITETTTDKSRRVLEEFVRDMSLTATPMNEAQRAQVHLSAVLACNFSNHLYVLAERMLKHQDVSFDILKPLIAECARKAVESHSPRSVQSGPASRNDVHTMNKHREMLVDEPYIQKLYTNLSQSIWETSKKK